MFLLLRGDLVFQSGDVDPCLGVPSSQTLPRGGDDGLNVDQVPKRVRDTGQHAVFKFLPADCLEFVQILPPRVSRGSFFPRFVQL